MLQVPPVHRPDPRDETVVTGDLDETLTVQAPMVHKPDPRRMDGPWAAAARAEEETTVLPPVPVAQPASRRVTWGIEPKTPERPESSESSESSGPSGRSGASEAAKTAVLPQAGKPGRSEDPVDRVPDWLFRPEEPEESEERRAASADPDSERTRELPPVDTGPANRPGAAARKPWRRPEWAEGTPRDDDAEAPTLADDLLGRRDGGPGGARRDGK